MPTYKELYDLFSNIETESIIPLETPTTLKPKQTKQNILSQEIAKIDYENQITDDDLEEYRLTEHNTNYNIDIQLNPGIYGLVGRNGIGKSTLLRKLKQNGGTHLLYQESLRCRQKVREILKYECKIFNEILDIEIEKLSGGWMRRIFIERALQSESKLILMDEPTNMLDLEGIGYLEREILKRKDKIFIIVSHDKEFLNNVTDCILYMDEKNIKTYKGNYDTFVKLRRIEIDEKLKNYKKQKANIEHLQKFVDRCRYNANTASQAQSKLKILNRMEPLEEIKPEIDVVFKMNSTKFTQKIMLEAFRIENLSRIVIVGPNGAGKTTFIKKITEMVPNTGYFQQIFDLPDLTVHEYLISQGATSDQAFKLIRDFGLTQDFTKISKLSGSQKSRVVLSAISLKNPSLLILDEPTNHLDMESIEALKIMIKNFKGAVITVSHDLRFIEDIFNEIFEINNGIRYFKGTIREYKNLLFK